MIKINDTVNYNKILTGIGVEQISPESITMDEKIILCKSADSLFGSTYIKQVTASGAAFDQYHVVPKGHTWRILGVSLFCSTQALTDIIITLRCRSHETGILVNFRWHESAAGTAANVGYSQTSMGSSGLILQAGDEIRFQATPAASASVISSTVIIDYPAGFATQ